MIKIHRATAKIADDKALAAFLAPMPTRIHEELRQALKSGRKGLTAFHGTITSRGFFVVSDGVTALCYTVERITQEQHAGIIAAVDNISDENISSWTVEAFQKAAEIIVGKTEYVQ